MSRVRNSAGIDDENEAVAPPRLTNHARGIVGDFDQRVLAPLLGTSLASWIFSSDVTFVPVIAAQAPALFKQVFNAGHVAIGVASLLTSVTGNVLLAVGTVIIPDIPVSLQSAMNGRLGFGSQGQRLK